ncbi:MAG: UvrD-helicase domain-containing protein, partial [Bacteroidetes bacterium]|nr:UvrD-helicase domain-containing protein [Bacteroidota bacterium]
LDSFLRMTFRHGLGGATEINISRRPRGWQQQNKFQRAQRELNRLKQYLDQRGFYLFRDMYTHANLACHFNEKLSKSIAKRFPLVFIDEMQDTNHIQYDIIYRIAKHHNNLFVVGDFCQSIYS